MSLFRALGTAVTRYFILYELEKHDIVSSARYLARLNAPTPWSQYMMPRLRNFVRGGGQVVASAGVGQGGLLAALLLEAHPEWEAEPLCRELASIDRIAAARSWSPISHRHRSTQVRRACGPTMAPLLAFY